MFPSEAESNIKLVEVIPYDSGFTLPFEKFTFGQEKVIADWCNERVYIPVLLSVVYGVAIYLGRKWMHSRPPFEIRSALVAWNLFLAIFSAIASFRIMPDLVYLLRRYGFSTSVCHAYGYSGVTGFWAILFIFSKPLELGDTVFIVLRKQPLQLLHWYHHMTVMVYSWWAWSFQMAAGRWFYTANFAVHALMYTYFALRAARFRLPSWFAMLVTSLQLTQMVIGLVALIYALLLLESGSYCRITRASGVLGILMYLSYFILFTQLFYNNYIVGSWSNKTKNRNGMHSNGMKHGKAA